MGQWHPFKVGALGPHTVLPVAISCPILFSWISSMVWTLFPLKGNFSFGKSQRSQGNNYGLRRGRVAQMIWYFTKKLYTRRDARAGMLLWWSCQSPGVHSCSLLIHPNSSHMEECSSFMENVMQIHCSTCSVILNVMATQYTCSHNSVYHPHWWEQWDHHCSCMPISVHSPWMPGYINITQTILVILTMAGLFVDRHCMCNWKLRKKCRERLG